MRKLQFESQKNIISQTLKLYRIRSGLTQAQLAARMQTMGINLDQQMISKIESNARLVTDYELACFCKALRITPQQLLGAYLEE